MTRVDYFGVTHDVIGRPIIMARVGDEVAGYLYLSTARPWHNDSRVVLMVEVEPPYRRQGIARQLWQYAKENGFNPVHEIEKTKDGEAWAKAVGD